MNFGIPDLSAGREPAPDTTRRRDQADNADFAALLDRAVDEPEQTEPRDNAVNRPAANATDKPREKIGRVDPANDEIEAEPVAATADDPSSSAQPITPQDTASEKPPVPAPAEAQTDAQDDVPQEAIIESVVAATIPAQMPPAKPVEVATTAAAPPNAPVDPANAPPSATSQPTGAEATEAAGAKAATTAVPPADFADQLAAAATKPTDAAKPKPKSETPAAAEPVAKPVAPAANAAAIEPVSPSADTASKRGTTQDNAQPAQTIVAPQTPAPAAQPSTATQGQNASAPAPVAPADLTNADDASLLAVLRAAAPQPQAAARPADGKPADPPPTVDALLKDVDIDTAPKPGQAKNDAAPKPFGALAPGLGLAAQITAQQVPEQANAADRLAQLAAAVTDKGKDAPVTTESSKPVDAASPAKSDPQPAPVDAPAQRQAAADVSNVNAAARMARPTFHPVVTQVAAQMAQAAADGTDKINIRLSPAELGRIDVKLDFGPDGRVQAVFAAERPQTMELLQRDARDLERALQDAGLRADSGSLSFNLRGQNRDAQDERTTGGHGQDGAPVEIAASQMQAYTAGSGGSGRLDIRI